MPPLEHLIWLAVAIFVTTTVVNRFLTARDRITGADAKKKVDEGALLVDVRTPGEYAASKLPGAKNIPVYELARRLDELARDQPVVVYCRSGARSRHAKRILAHAGFTVFDLGPAHAWG